jgi:hypothetical protein
MVYFLSIDVGIKNLSYCFFQKLSQDEFYTIKEWNVIDLSNKEKLYCMEKDKKNNECKNEAKYTKNNICYCLKHSKKNSKFFIPNKELNKSSLNKLNILQLKEIAKKYSLLFDKNYKKQDLLMLIHNFVSEKMLEPIKQVQFCQVDTMITYGKNINSVFNTFFDEYINCLDYVCIENQMTSKMRILSYMIAQYFIVKNNKINVDLISPCYKLKDLEPDKTNYKTRKQNSIKHCLDIISKNSNYIKWEKFFLSNNKKDDLSDAFLQGIWYIQNKIQKK